MPKGFFITGTDTGVGKTVAAGALISALKKGGLSVCGMKPVETGCMNEGGKLVPTDGAFLRDVSGVDEPMEAITPYCFEAPLAPMAASEMEGREIDAAWIKSAFRKLSEKYDAVLVEGIGGLLVPIKENCSVADLALELALPVVVVASPFLGTINHTLLTVDYARRAGLEVAGVILNYHRPPEGTLAESTNPSVLERLLPVPLIGTLPYMGSLDSESLYRTSLENLNLDILKKYL
jgi:dethiobiotin synthetase